MKKALFVDDEPLIAQGLSSILDWRQYGIEIAGSANDGVSALELIRKQPVDLLVTDIMMPRMNGLELIREVKESGAHTKFIVLSGYEEFEYVKAGIRLGIENYILKPINLDEFEGTIRQIRTEWDMDDQRRTRFHTDWEVLRSHVFQRWVAGEIGSREFKQRAELLGLSLESTGFTLYAVSPLSADDPDFYTYSNHLGSGRMLESAQSGETVCFMDADGDLILIEVSREPALGGIVPGGLREAAEQEDSPGKPRFWIAKAKTVSDYKSVPAAYEQAKSVFRHYLLPGGEPGCITEAGNLSGETEPVGRVWDPGAYLQLLAEGWTERVRQFIEEAFPAAGGGEPVFRKHCINTAIQLMIAAKEREGNPDYSEIFSPLGRIRTLPGLIRHVKEVVKQTLGKQEDRRSRYTPHVAFLVEQVQRRYAEELSLKTLSQKAGLHPYYLGQLFQQEVGTRFPDYVNTYRIEVAARLLVHTEQKTSDIARAVGYPDTSYFYRQFKKYTGVSPTELRQMYNK
ncbi:MULTISPECIES: response regulator transcription factor [Paenibacillus]|uniref:response regulator transcription factor n=1 Tax=Paenibacillus TaxID=44249 RepID=UPI002FE0E64B